jgi:hypothetical protein
MLQQQSMKLAVAYRARSVKTAQPQSVGKAEWPIFDNKALEECI